MTGTELAAPRTLAALRALPGFDNSLLTAGCPSRVLLDHLTSRWSPLVLLALSDGVLRWGELRRAVDGISEKMLAQTLRMLEADGLVIREVREVLPARVEYRLSALGEEATQLLLPLVEWTARHAAEMLAPADAAAESDASSAPGSSSTADAGSTPS